MLEAELFALIENTADAAYTVTPEGEVRSWNSAAERLFGFPATEVLGRNIDAVLDARDILGTEALAGRAEAATRRWDESSGIPNFDLDVRTGSGERIWVNVSTILFRNARTRQQLFVRLARDVTARRRTSEIMARMQEIARELASLGAEQPEHAPVDALSDQELRILRMLSAGAPAAAISRSLGISPQTLRNHLHHINRKLRTHTRLEAVTHARRRGLID